MRLQALPLAFFLLAESLSGADLSLLHARRAQALLGPDVWSQIIRIENTDRWSNYPRVLHAVVFELAGILWFYTDFNGTQSFSLHRGRLAEEKADFAPLLREIDPGFQHWLAVELDLAATASVAPDAPLPNGCFIESYAAYRLRVSRGAPISDARLLSYYLGGSGGTRAGHTVLAYSVPGGVTVVDPAEPGQERLLARSAGSDPVRLARALHGGVITRARVIPLEPPAGAVPRDPVAMYATAGRELPR
ncbi:MAG: hypothetical protein FJ399_00100 [Verrucomicrobia bacterium]|nr:hypothetical protein [Verrucomicrobiota bacterium]